MAKFAPCPDCSSTDARPVSFTWWGGALGPRIFHHVKCKSCGTAYNGKTGESNETAIWIYIGVSTAIGVMVAIGFVIFTRQ